MAVGEQVQTFLESVKRFWNEFDLKQWSEQVGGSSAEAIQAVVYFALSFTCGFILKRYFKFLFSCFIVSCFMILLMEFAKFVIIDWVSIKAFFGLTEPVDFNLMVTSIIDWVKNHILISIASLVGFFVGYKLG